ncbi:MAG: patatin-like phospholipase family protein [Cyclobacteriaceae bacterium]|nr:patatin-like phospholipase family protein [Cyclobacteriaceae bacterium]
MIGIALSGGGARGISHLGVLKALNEHDIFPGIVSGASAGSIVGGFYCSGFSPDETLEVIIKTNMLSIFKPAFSWKGLLSMDKLAKVLQQHLPASFEDLKLPLEIAATELEDGRTYYFSKGELIKPILASSCLPVLFNPIEIDGKRFVDGGVLNNLPVEGIIEHARFVMASSCNPIGESRKIKSFKDVMERSGILAINGNTLTSKAMAHLVIEPPELIHFSGFDLSKAREIFEAGYKYTKQNIATFEDQLKTT